MDQGMESNTISSAYGDLPLRKEGHFYDTLPALQFDDGDLLIKLSSERHAWLLLHSAVVAAVSPVLAVGGSPDWAESSKLDTIIHPSTGKKINVRTLALKLVDGTFLLEGKTFHVSRAASRTGTSFQNSELSESGWPHDYFELRHTVNAIKVLFTLIYGAELTHKSVPDCRESSHYSTKALNAVGIYTFATVCAYAQYYQCFDYIKPLIIRTMQSAPGYWGAIAYDPLNHLKLAKKLKLRDVYFDALRHLVAQACNEGDDSDKWEILAEEWSVSVHHVRSFYENRNAWLEAKTRDLKATLFKLQLSTVRAFWGSHYTGHTTFANVLQVLSPKLKATVKADEASEFLARSIFGQWLAQQLYGEHFHKAEKGRVRGKDAAGRLNLAILKIQTAAMSKTPAELFGLYTVPRITSIFSFSHWFKGDSSELLQEKLSNVVGEANSMIRETFPLEDKLIHDESGYWDVPCIVGRANYDAHTDGYFTYMRIPYFIPWDEDTADVEVVVDRPSVDVTPASEALMDLLVAKFSDEEVHDSNQSVASDESISAVTEDGGSDGLQSPVASGFDGNGGAEEDNLTDWGPKIAQ